MQIETVAIEDKQNKRSGKRIINQADFDPKKHKLFVAPAEPKTNTGKKNEETPPPKDEDNTSDDLKAAYVKAFKKQPEPGMTEEEMKTLLETQ